MQYRITGVIRVYIICTEQSVECEWITHRHASRNNHYIERDVCVHTATCMYTVQLANNTSVKKMSLAVQQLMIVIVCVFMFHGKYIVIRRALATTLLW